MVKGLTTAILVGIMHHHLHSQAQPPITSAMKSQQPLLNTLPFLILPPLFWSGNFVVGKAIHADIPPFSLAFLRWVIAFLVILPFAWRFIIRDKSLYRQNIGGVFATAIMGVACFNTLIYKGLHDTSTTNALLLNSCIPILIMLFGRVFYAQSLQRLQVIGLIISLFGVLNIILQGNLQRLLTLSFILTKPQNNTLNLPLLS